LTERPGRHLAVPANYQSKERPMSVRAFTSLKPARSADAGRIETLFARQREATERHRARFTLKDRLDSLSRLKETIKRREDDIVRALDEDFRKPESEVRLTEVFPVYQEISHAKRHLRSWLRPHRVPGSLGMFGTAAEVRYQAKGVCLIISPWNYPVNLSFGPLVSALAAGNTAILKPSELTPVTSAVIRKIVEETFPEELVAVCEGDASVSQALLDLPFDHIFFTGSPQVSKIVMAAAAKHLTSVTLELGGKSPTIVDSTASIEHAARKIVWGKFANNGQTCIAPDHVYVARDQARPKPLAIYIYSEDAAAREYITERTSSGGVCVNNNVVHFLHPNLPFGGVNKSGIGAAHGFYGFKAFSHERAILKDKFSILGLLFPPYTPTVKKLINLTVRLLG
jgi:acyl-CoA reductase-like NAD-dependent aldehyde dehydrogenase